MPNQNVAIIRRLTEEGFVAGNIDIVDEVVAIDCLDHDPSPGQPQGRAGQRAMCAMVVNGLSDRRTVEHDCFGLGDIVAESWTFRGTHSGEFMGVAPTGREIDVRGVEIWRCANGQIVERWGTVDTGAVMMQIQGVQSRRSPPERSTSKP